VPESSSSPHPAAGSEDRLSSIFSALADPTRRAIVARLGAGEATVNELAEPFPVSLPAISRHLKVLERAGLITRSREGQWRPCRLRAEPLRSAAEWLADYRKFWEGSFDRLEDHLAALRAEAPKQKQEQEQEEGER
jgi:DNA-binding transcriptional ArsR family regulator